MSATSATTARTGEFATIPEVSLARWRGGDRDGFAGELLDVCHHVGFLHLVDHGIPAEFLDRYLAALDAFFELPEDVKATIDKRFSRHFRGWERVGAELTDGRVDHREQLDVATEHPSRPADVLPAYLRLDGPNQWPDEAVLPGFGALVGEYLDRMSALADELMAALCLGFGLPENHLAELFGERRLSLAKLIDYPPTPPGEAGVNGHHDAGFLTLLLQPGTGGLQALNAAGEWINVPPRRDAFVVNIGEMLQAMSGNYLVATMHRVISPAHRRTAAYFHGPDLRTRLDPLPLEPAFAEAVAASERHRSAGFMAKRDELRAGLRGTSSTSAPVFGEQLWNYYVRSYPDNVRAHYPDLIDAD